MKERIITAFLLLFLLPGCMEKEDELTAGLTDEEKEILWLDKETFEKYSIWEEGQQKYTFYTPDSIYIEQIKTNGTYTEYRYYPDRPVYDRNLYYSSGRICLKSSFLKARFSPLLGETSIYLSAHGKRISYDKEGKITDVKNYTNPDFAVTKEDMLTYIGDTEGYIKAIGYRYDQEVNNPVGYAIPKMSYIEIIYPDGDTRFVSFDAHTGELLRDDLLYYDRIGIRYIRISEGYYDD